MFARVGENRITGSPAVVLVHGLGCSSRYMVPLAVDLARDCRIYAPDLPGFGRSEKPRSVLDIPQLAALLKAWLEKAEIRKPILVGNSWGCQLIVELAATNPDVVAAAVLLGPTADTAVSSSLEHLRRLLQDALHEPLSLILLEAFEYVQSGPLRLHRTFEAARRHDMLERIAVMKVPCLLARGEHDPVAPRSWLHKLASRAQNAELIEVPGAGHALNYNSPGEVAKHCRSLMSRLSG